MKYRIWVTITIRHAYFSSGDCGLELAVSDETAAFMRKAGLLFRKQFKNQWAVLMPETESGLINPAGLFFKDEVRTLIFELQERSGDFFYYTDWPDEPVQGAGWTICNTERTAGSKKSLWISITPESAEETKDIGIVIPSRQVCWEFILIPKYNHACPVELRESKGKLTFSVPEKTSFPGEDEVYRCVTASSVAMKEIYDYKIGLWQKRDKGELLISDHIPHPRPHALSISHPQEMITSYFYF